MDIDLYMAVSRNWGFLFVGVNWSPILGGVQRGS